MAKDNLMGAEMTKSNIVKLSIIGILLVGGVYAYNNYSKEMLKQQAKEVAIDTAKSTGKFVVEKGKEKWQEKKEIWKAKLKEKLSQ